jgi:hypothetical protein
VRTLSLASLQIEFQTAVMHATAPGNLLAPPAPGFAIYAHAYPARLCEALRDNYPALHQALGDEAFAQIALAYLAAHPSTHRSIRWFGDALCDFLDTYSEHAPEPTPHPALTDLARLDWALRCAFDAADAAPLTTADLAAIAPDAWPAQRFALHPSVQLITLNWHVEPLWHSLTDTPDADTCAPEPGTHRLRVWRHDLECHWRTLTESEAQALHALAHGVTNGATNGATFSEVCDAFAHEPDPASLIASTLQTWVSEGVLIAF